MKENFRYINTKFWDDNFIQELDPSEKLLFLYFLTNPLTNLIGIYEISYKRIAFDTGFDKEMITKILERFQKAEKIFYINGWVFIKNLPKNQRYRGEKLERAIEIEKEMVPIDILAKIKEIRIGYQYPTDTVGIGKGIYKDKYIYKDIISELISSPDKPLDNTNQLMDIFYKINPSLNYGNLTQRKASNWLIERFGIKEVLNLAKYACQIQSQKFAPVITTPIHLKEKIAQLKIYIEKNKLVKKPNPLLYDHENSPDFVSTTRVSTTPD